MIKTEFSTTAMNRPELIDRTYSSFCSNIKAVDYRNSTMYLNVDPMPEDADSMNVVNVAKKYFGNVVYRIPEEANFTAAVQWCWSQVKGKHVFHLEDDWILRKNVSFKGMIDYMEAGHKGEKIVQVYLRRSNSVHHKKVCLSPSLLDGDFVRQRSKIFDLTVNPECQLRGRLGGISVHFTSDMVIRDIGREWLRDSKYRRPKAKREFTKWEPK